jgi:hypothetical protein
MAALTKFHCFPEDLAEGKHNLASDALKLLLTNTAPNAASHTVKDDITEIANGNGYTTGGLAVTVSSSLKTGGVYKLVIADIAVTVSGGPLPAWRYGVLYNDTHASDPLIGYLDRGSSITLADGSVYVFDADPTTGVLTIT